MDNWMFMIDPFDPLGLFAEENPFMSGTEMDYDPYSFTCDLPRMFFQDFKHMNVHHPSPFYSDAFEVV